MVTTSKCDIQSEYIEREAVYEDFENCNSENTKWTPSRVKTLIAYQKAADVAPVRHARWGVEVGMNFFKERNCPVCKNRIESNFWNYCPNCGAKMDI